MRPNGSGSLFSAHAEFSTRLECEDNSTEQSFDFFQFCWGLSIGSCAAFAQTAPKEETSAKAQSQVASDALKKIDQLVRQNEQLEKQNHELIGRN